MAAWLAIHFMSSVATVTRPGKPVESQPVWRSLRQDSGIVGSQHSRDIRHQASGEVQRHRLACVVRWLPCCRAGFPYPPTLFHKQDITDGNRGAISDELSKKLLSAQYKVVGVVTYVDLIRDREEGPPDRTGDPTELRLTENWTSSVKRVVKFDVQGSVAKSTHAGLLWLRRIRAEVGKRVHFWSFDGWDVPENKSVIAEVYPSILRNRYARGDRTADQQDAYCVARWLTERDERGFLAQYFQPSLTDEEREIADLEGWILGIR